MSAGDVTFEAPRHDRAALRPRILHLGFGAFGRAHPMWFLDRGLDAAGGDWGVIAARLNSGADALDALDAAQGRYHVAAADEQSARVRRIDCVIGTRHPARDGSDALPDLIATPGLDVILLTVTEKGYCQRAGRLDPDRPDVAADLARQGEPGTAIGVLAEGLRRRRDADGAGLTILSCDNIPGNGDLLRRVVRDFAERVAPDLAEWIGDKVAFPNSMVDRITPALDADGRALLRDAVGGEDANGIVTEPFHQWVIEDRFVGPRPPFAEGGAELVADVRPFEEMKLRMLNGAHTFLAHAGRLAGHETVADAIGDPVLRAATRRLMMDEQVPTLDMPGGVDLAAYADALVARFDNTRLRHRLDQIAQDTSQKVPQRLLAPAAANAAAGRGWPLTALAIASWIVALRELPAVADPRQDDLRQAASGSDPVASVLSLPGLADAPDALLGPVTDAHATIAERGISAALKEAM
ncbi:mannitol dehydrogenase family protein [Roseivivax isoporae]|uniref:D-mannonate oxidoreductase n=1 Tax=Roseivivax isoporae LMG 25204 TaxID=1449351 RepID=X7F7N5_9RHOB|nr:mannitol dehydrogenase family protein [Roseivivax isoporae]ETX28054.1 D-mannonate oxidoreductase [Roseivivax isoporae LMG 25204]